MTIPPSIRRQLAPTVGQRTFGSRFRPDSTLASASAGIGDSIAVDRILYASNTLLIPKDETWIPAHGEVTSYSIVPIGEVDLFIGYTDPAPLTQAVMIEAEVTSGFDLSAEAEEFWATP